MVELPPLPVPPKSSTDSTPDGAVPSGPAPVPHSLSHRVRGLSCPNCAGVLDVDSGLRVVICPYCETHLLSVGELGTRRFAVEPAIDSERARQIASQWLSTGIQKDRALRRQAEVREAFLSFLPFYRVEADCIGFALGTEKRRRLGGSKGRRVRTYEVNVERSAARSFDQTYPAVNVAEWGIRRVDLRGDPIVAYDAGALDKKGMVFPPTGSERAIRDAALEQFKQATDPSRGLHRVRFRFLQSLRERLSVVYYPLWVVRYRFKERSYQVLVDGESGELAYGKAAGNDLYRAGMLIATEAAAAFIATTAWQIGGVHGVSLFVVAFAIVIFLWGWRKFRWGGVVIEGTGLAESPGFSQMLESAVQSPQTLLSTALEQAGRRR